MFVEGFGLGLLGGFVVWSGSLALPCCVRGVFGVALLVFGPFLDLLVVY
jgi:hypothetical protein